MNANIFRCLVFTGSQGFVGQSIVQQEYKRSTIQAKERTIVFFLTHKTLSPEQATIYEKLYPLWQLFIVPLEKTNTRHIQNYLPQNYNIPTTIVYNLAGENIGSGIWTAAKKHRIAHSRIWATEQLKLFLNSHPVSIWFQASAIGIYKQTKHNFLSTVCHNWETAAQYPQATLQYNLRFGIVCHPSQGFLKRLLAVSTPPIIPVFGKGAFNWIHIEDILQIIMFLQNTQSTTQTNIHNIDMVQPTPTYQAQLGQYILKYKTRQATGVLRFLWKYSVMATIPDTWLGYLGAMGTELLQGGPIICPTQLIDLGYTFAHQSLGV
jgi:uncharacterized protein